MADTVRRFIANGDVDGEYVVDEELPDGALGHPRRHQRGGDSSPRRDEQLRADEFAEHFGRLPGCDDG